MVWQRCSLPRRYIDPQDQEDGRKLPTVNDKIRFGILSFAHHHSNFWAEAANDSLEAELVGVWDDNVSRGREAADKYGTRFFHSRAALLDECSAVGITSETAKHADLVEEAAQAGVHILLEKPMARNLEECRRIVRAVQAAGVKFQQSFPKRYDPINHQLVDLVHNGRLGKIAMVRVRHANYHLLELGHSAAEEWFGDPAQSGGGALLDEGVHAADFLLWLLGLPDRVFAMTSDGTLGLPLEDTALAIFQYNSSGTLAEIATSGTMVAAQESIGVYGTGGTAIISGVDLASRDFTRDKYLKVFYHGDERGEWAGPDTVPYFKQGNFHQQVPLHFFKVLTGQAESVVSLEDGWKSVAMIQAAYDAVRNGEAQSIVQSL
jgi:predicted dehydrogenase